MAAAYLDALNDDQRAAVEHGVSTGRSEPAGPLLIIAGAGSGKTNVLAHRVAHLLVNGADPSRILLMTFSRRAAVEMAQRVERIGREVLGRQAAGFIEAMEWTGTFHGVGARVLRELAPQLGLHAGFTIHDREDAADLINLVRHDLGYSKLDSRFPTKATCLSIYSRCVNSRAPLEWVLRSAFPWCSAWEDELRSLFAAYVQAKQRQNVLDFDDLLLYWAHAVSEPAIASALSERFDHILVDEYQDTNSLQSAILMALKPDGSGLTVVGDDAQSIYAFRAATVRNILDFPAAFSPPARIVMLERNYRSSQPILDAANAVIALAAERFSKTLWTDRFSEMRPRLITVRSDTDQARYIVEQVLNAREAGLTLKQQAVLFRTSSHSNILEIELTRRNLPYVKFGGLRFLDTAHVKDLLAILRFVQNPRDRVTGFRVMQMLPGVGPVSAQKAHDHIAQADDPIAALAGAPRPAKAAHEWTGFVALVEALASGDIGWPLEIERVRQWYETHIDRLFEDAEVRRGDLDQLEKIAVGFSSRQKFLTDLVLDPPDATSDEAGVPLLDEDYLTLSTIHSAKGQEWASVFVLNVVDGCMPSDMSTGQKSEIEEERRLLYVAMTRAKDELHLMLPQRFYVHGQAAAGDRHVTASRTRFIPQSLLGLFERTSWPRPTAFAPASPPSGLRIDVGERAKASWGR